MLVVTEASLLEDLLLVSGTRSVGIGLILP